MKSKWTALLVAILLSGCAHLHSQPADLGEPGMQTITLDQARGLRAQQSGAWASARITEVVWDSTQTIEPIDRKLLCETLREALQKSLSGHQQESGRHLSIKARITEAVPVSPLLNTLTAILIFVPVERGGAAVQIEAFDQESGQKIASLSVAKSASLTDLHGYFSRYTHAQTVLQDAAATFANLLEPANASHS